MTALSFLNRFASKVLCNHQPKTRSNRQVQYLEALESRILLTSYTWDPLNAVDDAWENPTNWLGGGFPQNAEDEARFVDVGSLTIKISDDYVINKLLVKGGAHVTLIAIDGHHTLAVEQLEDVGGNVVIEQDATHETVLELSKFSAEDSLTLEAYDLKVAGNTGGSSAFIVNFGTAANISTDLEADGYFFKLDDHGFIMAANVIITGKATTLPATVFPESTIDGCPHGAVRRGTDWRKTLSLGRVRAARAAHGGVRRAAKVVGRSPSALIN